MPKSPVAVVTGGAGFIGSHLAERLLAEGYIVRVLDNLSTGRRENLAFAERAPAGRFELIEADLLDVAALGAALRGADAVLHEAALPSVPRSIADPLESNRVNINGTLQVLMSARDAGVSRVLYASSSSIYGDAPVLPKVETLAPAPMSPYAVGKLAGEHYGRAFHRVYGLGFIGLRYFNVFGPRQDPASEYAAVIPRFIKAIVDEQTPIVYGDGQQSRDFTYISDVVEANWLALRAPDAACGQAYNAAAGRRVTLLELLQMLAHLLGRPVAPRFEPSRAGDVKHSQADSGQAAAALGWRARVSMEDGLQRTVASWPRAAGHAP
jgi:nucleoside-diphosphate-sugar epimerase